MSPTPGERIGPYEITTPLGEGGMGVVFRARDTQLLRDVAMKFLPGRFENDTERLGRFQREAQVLASLNHPNIAQIYGFQPAGVSGAIVMELVQGETLAQRLTRGPLPLDQVILIAKQMVDALETAHKRGVIHRDLKPANIKLTPDGKVKVLDFGLAKALAGDGPAADAANSPTILSGSIAGTIMGTAAYMSPEQARGSELDATTDIWSFGCVLYELLTSKPVFTGATATDIIAKVIEAQPNWELLPAETPLPLRMLLASALTKDRSERLQNIGDARVFLKTVDIPKASAAATRTGWRGRLLTAALTLALVAALVPASIYFLRTPEQQAEIRFEIPAQRGVSVPVISPDGRNIAYTAQTEGKTSIWVRPMADLKARPLPGTENGLDPFWSPDSRSLAFFADGKLKKISLDGGPATAVADTDVTIPGAWGRQGIILFSKVVEGSPLPAIVRIPESGGTPIPVTKPGTKGHFLPQLLPDTDRFLYLESDSRGEEMEILGTSLEGTPPVRIASVGNTAGGNFPARYALPGHLLFVRDNVLLAQSFDARRLVLAGQPVAIAEQVGPFWVSNQGTIVYRNAAALASMAGGSQLQWIDRDGKSGPLVGMGAIYGSLALSPDGRRVAVDKRDGGNSDIWVIDLDRGIPNRLTIDPASDYSPRWSPDGKKIVFTSSRGATSGSAAKIFQRSSLGIGGDEPVDTQGDAGVTDIALDLSPDSKYLVFLRAKSNFPVDIWIKPMFGDGKPFPYVQSKSFRYDEPVISPNGRWLAYATNESGIHQIVVQTFPDPKEGKWQITARGGIYPKWRGDSRELYYVALDGKLMAVPVKETRDFQSDEPKALFQTPLIIPSIPGAPLYDVAADGKRFLFIAPGTAANGGSATPADTITTIVNWTAALKKK